MVRSIDPARVAVRQFQWLSEAAAVLGTHAAEAILASDHARLHPKAVHMEANDLIKNLRSALARGSRPHTGLARLPPGADCRGLMSGLATPEKAYITATCERFIANVLKPRFLPVVRPTEFNYPVDIQGKWHGTRYRLVQRCRSGFDDNHGEEFDAPFVRLDWIAPDRFNIQWHRHTGAWFCLHRGKTLAQALKLIESDGILHPNQTGAAAALTGCLRRRWRGAWCSGLELGAPS